MHARPLPPILRRLISRITSFSLSPLVPSPPLHFQPHTLISPSCLSSNTSYPLLSSLIFFIPSSFLHDPRTLQTARSDRWWNFPTSARGILNALGICILLGGFLALFMGWPIHTCEFELLLDFTGVSVSDGFVFLANSDSIRFDSFFFCALSNHFPSFRCSFTSSSFTSPSLYLFPQPRRNRDITQTSSNTKVQTGAGTWEESTPLDKFPTFQIYQV